MVGRVPSPNGGLLRRARIPLLAATAAAAVVVAGVSPLGSPGGLTGVYAAPAPPSVPSGPGPSAPVPAPKPLPPAVDLAPAYEGNVFCDQVVRPGTEALRQLLLRTYGPRETGMLRGCGEAGVSEHKDGRALDWMVNARQPDTRAQAEAFLKWLTDPGPTGIKAENARRLGIMYIGWNNQFWRGYDVDRGRTELKGCYSASKQSASWDTFCHRNHVHFSLTWDGAAAQTSYWDGTPQVAPPCAGAAGSTRPAGPAPGSDIVTVPAVHVIDTRTGLGAGRRACRLQQDRWSGDNHRLVARVTGVGQVPRTGVSAVVLRLSAVTSDAPTWLTAWPTGGPRPATRSVSVALGGTASSTVVVPVAANGTISVVNFVGQTDVSADVVGYIRSQPGVKSATSGRARPSAPPPAVPGPASGSGSVHLITPASGYDGPAIGPGETRVVSLSAAGVPAGGTRAALVTVTATSAGTGLLQLGAPGSPGASGGVRVAGAAPRTSSMLVSSADDGRIAISNDGPAPVQARLAVLGWVGRSDASGSSLTPVPSRTLRSAVALVAGSPITVRVRGRGGVPATADIDGALLSVTSIGTRKAGGLTVWPSGAAKPAVISVSAGAGTATTDLVAVPLGADGSVSLAADLTGIKAQVDVVGYLR